MRSSTALLSGPLAQLTLARIREFYREPGAVFWVFGFPILMAIGLGIAFRSRPPEQVRVVVVDTPQLSWAADALDATKGIAVERAKPADAWQRLRAGAFDLLIRAPETTDGSEGAPRVVYVLDPTREGARAARLTTDDVLQRARGRVDVLVTEEEILEESGARYIDFLLPGLIGLNLMGSSMWGIGYSIVLNRKRRLLKRLAATPMRRSHYLLSYILSRLAFLTAEVVALIGFGALAFGVTVHGSWIALALVALLGAGSFAGIALLVAARIESIEAASGWLNFVMLPMWLLSGSFFSYERFPEVIQPALKVLPLTALNDALRAIMNRGAPVWTTWPELVIIFVWGAVCFAIAQRRFRWQ